MLSEVRDSLPKSARLWVNHRVPPNDGGLSFGHAALAVSGR